MASIQQDTALEKWGFTLPELYRLALSFYKQNSGKAIHLSYEDNLKLIAFKQQATIGPFDANSVPELGVLDVIGRDRRMHWQLLGDINREQAMEGFIDLLDNMCTAFRPYVEAVKQNRDETLKQELRRMEQDKLEQEKREREQKELLEGEYKEELQRRQIKDTLNKQAFQQFKTYAESQFPGNPEQQGVLIRQLQDEHYHQFMQQLHMHNKAHIELGDEGSKRLPNEAGDTGSGLEDCKNEEQQQDDGSQDEFITLEPAKMWTRPDIEEFKAEVLQGEGDGVLHLDPGEVVTVRVPTMANGKSIFWEFASDNYDVGFGLYFEWSKPTTTEVVVHETDSETGDFDVDDDIQTTNEDLESGSVNIDRESVDDSSTSKPFVSIIVPIYRRDCFNEVYVGSHTYPGEGVYLLKFSNSYSFFRS